MGETYYDVLGVAPDATDEEIRAAYRERVLETHPDHNDAPDAAAQFDRVSTARNVLADGTERARYDRLGHDSYVRLARRAAGSSAGDSDSGNSSAEDSSGGGPSNSAGERTGSSTESRNRYRSPAAGSTDGRGESHDRTETDGRTESHHARQRRRRRRQTTRQRAAGGGGASEGGNRGATGAGTTSSASSATDGSGSRAGVGAAAGVGATTGRATAGRTGTTTTATGAHVGSDAESASKSESESESEFRYAVHDWEGDVDLEWEGGSIDHSTAVTIGCLWLLYPVLVASSLTSMFPLAVNAIVATCTLCVVGYLLTKPRVAISLFGFWSLLIPMGLSQGGIAALDSMPGLLALGFVWVPFGYAVALWWALRP